MKAPSSDASKEDGAETNENMPDGPIVFNYCDFFSVLMYYYHMSKEAILGHSRGFLHGMYRMHVKRACENLGVSSDGEEGEEDSDSGIDSTGYPTRFYKLPARKKADIPDSTPDATKDFLKAFGGDALLFRDVQITDD